MCIKFDRIKTEIDFIV